MEKVLTLHEVAEFLRVSPHTIRAWVYERRIIPIKLGRRVLFTQEEIQRFIERGKDEGLRQTYRSRFSHC